VAASAAGDAVAGAAELAGKGCDAVFVDHSTVERDPAAARALGRAIAQRGSKLILLAPLARRGSCELLLGTGIEQTLAKPVRRSHLVRALRGLPSAAPLVPAERPAAPARALRVLVVDDHPINQRVALGLLQKLGHGGEVASNGSEALVRLEHECFDLVLLDCQMPVMDGYEFARQLRLRETTGGALPLIAMTANALRGDREACIAAGMNDYLTKPLSLDALRRTLENWCDGAQRTSGPAP
jgi:CheY-like chemotaxis protein